MWPLILFNCLLDCGLCAPRRELGVVTAMVVTLKTWNSSNFTFEEHQYLTKETFQISQDFLSTTYQLIKLEQRAWIRKKKKYSKKKNTLINSKWQHAAFGTARQLFCFYLRHLFLTSSAWPLISINQLISINLCTIFLHFLKLVAVGFSDFPSVWPLPYSSYIRS